MVVEAPPYICGYMGAATRMVNTFAAVVQQKIRIHIKARKSPHSLNHPLNWFQAPNGFRVPGLNLARLYTGMLPAPEAVHSPTARQFP